MRPQPARYRRKSSPSKAYPRPRHSSRRPLQYAFITITLLVILFILISPKPRAVQDLGIFHHAPSHKPPTQTNSTSGEVRWYSDWKWLKPFSASITLDEDRSVLPPLKTRPPIYTFYDAEEEKDIKVRTAENRLLLFWRRAWWAKGFRPVVLGKSEAVKNSNYEHIKTIKLEPQMEHDVLRWLAWGQMGSGILANWLVHPMGAYDENLLTALRKGEYSTLQRYEGLGGGLFSGEKTAINDAIAEALKSPKLKEAKSILDVVSDIKVDPRPSEIAFYDAKTNADLYKPITTALTEDKANGLESLAILINSHLHLTFINNFPNGFVILAPFVDAAGVLARRGRAIAESLRTCPATPMPSSCPPNLQRCRPCPSPPQSISTPGYFTNTSKVFTIGPVPHPYTLASLKGKTKELTTRHIRRDTDRDPWLDTVTAKTLGNELGGLGRIVSFKEMVAGDWGFSRSLWMTEDQAPQHKDLEYHFGFSIPLVNTTSEFILPDETTVPPSTKPKAEITRSMRLQTSLFDAAQAVLTQKKKAKEKARVRKMVEAWNLADTEAWHFVRAFAAREKVERVKWEQEERAFSGGDPDHGQGVWRWFDRL